MFWVATLIQKLQPRNLHVKNESGKERQNNEIEVTTEIKEGKNIFMSQHHIPCRDLNFQVTTKILKLRPDWSKSQ